MKPPSPVQPYEALPEEKAAVIEYALKHPELRHRELAWRMVDEDVVYVSSSTVYRILREAKLVCPWRRRTKRHREEAEKAWRPNQIWATDIKYVWVGDRHYFLVCFLDEYSRYIVHHELLLGMDGATVSVAAQAALEQLPKDTAGKLLARPAIRSDNGSCYISREFGRKISIATSNRRNWVLAAMRCPDNPYDGHTLQATLAATERNSGVRPTDAPSSTRGIEGMAVTATYKSTLPALATRTQAERYASGDGGGAPSNHSSGI